MNFAWLRSFEEEQHPLVHNANVVYDRFITESSCNISVDLPGLDINNTKMSVDTRTKTLTIDAVYKKTPTPVRNDCVDMRPYGSCKINFRLPVNIDVAPDQCQSWYADGTLNITLPLVNAKTAHVIPIKNITTP